MSSNDSLASAIVVVVMVEAVTMRSTTQDLKMPACWKAATSRNFYIGKFYDLGRAVPVKYRESIEIQKLQFVNIEQRIRAWPSWFLQ
jgi:hypothetical protein